MLRTVLLVALAVVAVSASADNNLRLANGAKLTTSGLSAGAFAAQQFAIAFSANVSGVGVFAGGPYYCAQGREVLALTTCMYQPWSIFPSVLADKAKEFAKDGKIDSVENLKHQKVYLYSGILDAVVLPGVVKKIEEFYSLLDANVTATEYSISSAHGMPTMDYGNPCAVLGAPFVLKCNYDGAGEALRVMYGLDKLKPAVPYASSQIITLDQRAFMTKGKSTVGFGEHAYAYIPQGCEAGAVCDVHVAWHGCNQDNAQVEGAVNVHAGYDGYAEANNIIILYPQAARALIKNPQACFDWWGYSDKEYAFKSGAQLSAVMAMATYLSNGGR